MLEILADTLFTLSAISGQTNYQRPQMMAYAQEHFEIRQKLKDGTQFTEDRFGMAHGELGQVCMLSGLYEKSIEHCRIAIDITIKSPRFQSGDDWPTWANCHQAFALSALGQFDEGMKLMKATEFYHLSRFDNKERWSFQWVHFKSGIESPLTLTA